MLLLLGAAGQFGKQQRGDRRWFAERLLGARKFELDADIPRRGFSGVAHDRARRETHARARRQARAAVARLTDLFAGGEYAAVPATAARLKESALASRSARLTWHHALVQSSLSRELGDFTDASRWADEAMMQGAAGRVPDTLGAAVLGRVLLAIQRADLVPFLPQVIHFRSMQPENPIALACLSLGLAQSGDLAAARAAARSGQRSARG